jgi:SAM-dependent methyltransferase
VTRRRRTQASVTQVLGLGARRLRLTSPAFKALERYKAFRGRGDDITEADGLPLPPPLLRVRVNGDPDPEAFLRLGREGARVIGEAVARHSPGGMEGLGAVLDFGCGCGRLARHWDALDGPEVFGCDLNPDAIAWCRANLRFMQADTNGLAPPLPHPSERFDLVYATSVFTHLSEAMQHEWMAEMRRVLRPGGLLFLTTKGDSHADELTKPGRPGLENYKAGRFVVTDDRVEGLNLCAAYHPYDWVVNEMLTGFELLEFAPSGATMSGGQDFYLVRRL